MCYLSYTCIPVSLTHALLLLGTFGAPQFVMVFVGISMTLRVSCVSLIVFLYFGNLGNSRYLSLPLGTIWYVPVLILSLGTSFYYLVPTWYLLGTYWVPTRYLSVSLGNFVTFCGYPFLAALSSSRSVDVGPSVGPSVRPSTL